MLSFSGYNVPWIISKVLDKVDSAEVRVHGNGFGSV